MGKIIYIVILTILSHITSLGLNIDPIKWEQKISKIDNNKYKINIIGYLNKNWYVYEPKLDTLNMPKLSPNATTLYLKTNNIINIKNIYIKKGQEKIINKKKLVGNYLSFDILVNVNQNKSINDINYSLSYSICNYNQCIPNKIYNQTIKLNNKIYNQIIKLISIFLIAFLSGLYSLSTPCILSTIPVTISILNSENKKIKIKPLIFSITIIIFYSSLGIIIYFTGIKYINVNTPISNLILFILHITLGIFLLFNINLKLISYKLVNKLDKLSDIKIFGPVFMALTTCFMSFTCISPIIGSVIINSINYNIIYSTILILFAYSLGMSLPFLLISFIKYIYIPKYRNSKKLVGIIELIISIKFLSSIDLLYGLNIFNRQIVCIIYIIILIIGVIYLIYLEYKNSTIKNNKYVILIISIIGLFLCLHIYIIRDKNISLYGFIPYIKNNYKLVYTNDINAAQIAANKFNKPILINFTGYTCSNCLKMQDLIDKNEECKKIINKNFIILYLYTDEIKKYNIYNNFKSIGKKNYYIQINKFKTNTIPFYIVTDSKLNNHYPGIGYTNNANEYINWLKKSLYINKVK